MHEPDIAPLARRLAEENNVDWRRLAGTGEGGRVVERDVLGYLARVMAGEEAVDPTPEPVPEGMEAWPADDVGRYGGSELDDEPTSPPTLDDDLFLFDEPPPPEAGDADDALFVAEERGGSRETEPAPLAARVAEDEDGHVIDAAVPEDGEPEGDDGVWLVGDDALKDDAAATEADAWAAEADAATGPSAAQEGDGGMRIDELPDLTLGGGDSDAPAREDEEARLPGGRDALELPDLFADEAVDQDEAVAAHDALVLDEAAPAVQADDGADEGVAQPEIAAPYPAGRGPADEAPAAPPSPAGGRDEVSDAASGSAAPAWSGSLVRHGQLWRRRFDDRPLRQVTSDAASALEVAPATMVVLLMARAASRAGLADGAVDAWRWRRAGVDRIAIDPEAEVRDAARRIETRAARDDAPPAALVVADLGDLGVDEAVLHLEVPVLALGRSTGDGAWLSLSGDDLDGGAASGLARVAEFLAAPVRLLL